MRILYTLHTCICHARCTRVDVGWQGERAGNKSSTIINEPRNSLHHRLSYALTTRVRLKMRMRGPMQVTKTMQTNAKRKHTNTHRK